MESPKKEDLGPLKMTGSRLPSFLQLADTNKPGHPLAYGKGGVKPDSVFNLKNAASVADRGAPIGMNAKVSTTSSGSKRGRGRPLGSKNKFSSQESAKNFAKDGYPGGIQRRNSKMD